MPVYSYIAINADGQTVDGKVDSTDRNSVISVLSKSNLRPISIKEQSKLMSGIGLSRFFKNKKVKSDTLVIFTRELSAMVSAGVPLLRALSSLERYSENKVLKEILDSVIHDVEGGAPLAEALAKFPETFNEVYVNMVRVGETAGILDDILQRLATQQEKNSSMRKRIKSAMTYPVVLVTITIAAFFGLMIFVIPSIGNTIKDLSGEDTELPALTRFMLAISDFITNWWFIIIPVIAVLAFLLLRYIRTKRGKWQFHSLLLKIPGVNTIIMKLAVAQFARTFSVLMSAGVAVLESLHVTSRSIGNVVYQDAIEKSVDEVKNGKQLSQVIGSNELFPPIVSQMLAVGEETGQTDKVLVKVADFYEEEVSTSINGISSIIEPAMIIVIGGMVGLIAASVMLPIAGMAQTIQE